MQVNEEEEELETFEMSKARICLGFTCKSLKCFDMSRSKAEGVRDYLFLPL